MSNPFCETCNHEHGPLYICEHYSDERKLKLAGDAAKLRSDLQDPEWCKANGLYGSALAIMKAFMGVE